MLKRLIRNIRRKPKHVRDNIALMLALVITSGVFSVWLYNAPARFTSIDDKQAQTGTTEEKAGFADLFSNIGKQFASIREVVVTSVASTTMGTTTTNSELLQSVTDLGESNFGFTEPPLPSAREVRIVTIKATTSATTSASEGS